VLTNQGAALEALADPSRRSILELLVARPLSVVEISAAVPISRPAVSQHLKVLREAELIRSATARRTSAYELAPGPLFEIETWARELAERWTAGPLPRSPGRPAATATEQRTRP
jgi:DNA-binding transcriptional ArsR family regulator